MVRAIETGIMNVSCFKVAESPGTDTYVLQFSLVVQESGEKLVREQAKPDKGKGKA